MRGVINIPYKEEVRGSNPLAPTGFFRNLKQNCEQKYPHLKVKSKTSKNKIFFNFLENK